MIFVRPWNSAAAKATLAMASQAASTVATTNANAVASKSMMKMKGINKVGVIN